MHMRYAVIDKSGLAESRGLGTHARIGPWIALCVMATMFVAMDALGQ